MIVKRNTLPALDGASTGLLYNVSILSLDETLKRSNAYFFASDNVLALSGRFLRGLFLTAKELVFYDNGFIVESGARLFILTVMDEQSVCMVDKNAVKIMAGLGAKVASVTPGSLARWISESVK